MELTKKELMKKLKALGKMDKQTRNDIVCSLIGHSRIQSMCFGYYYCGRCGTQVGDGLASVYPEAEEVVIIDHKCIVCKKNYKKCTWRDKLYVIDPFKKSKELEK